jgi:hypothetical protein
MLKLEMVLEEINYNELILSLLPRMLSNLSEKDDKSGRLGKVLSDMGNLPGNMITAALDALPQEEKNNLVVKILDIYKEEITQLVKNTMEKNHISVDLSELQITNI